MDVDAQNHVTRVRELIDRGDPLQAVDAADAITFSSLPASDAVAVRYLRALASARAGAAGRARDELDAIDLSGIDVDDSLAEDIAALAARLVKDRSLRHSGAERMRGLAEAAGHYEAAYRQYRRPFACVNAASMHLLSGNPQRARELANDALASLDARADAGYWSHASRAEAELILGHLDSAETSLRSARATIDHDAGDRSTTMRQLRLLCDDIGIDPTQTLGPLANASVIHFCGHRLAPLGHHDADEIDVETLSDAVRVELDRRSVGFAYGSLAAGADILIAEIALEAGAELHVVLPFSVQEFIATSVAPFGERWTNRFHRCLTAARDVSITCDSAYGRDDTLFGHAAAVAMGQAIIRAHGLSSDVRQLAVWDGRDTDLPAGTAHDVALWRKAGHPTTVIGLDAERRDAPPRRRATGRIVRALLFGDIEGFSALRDEHFVIYLDRVLAEIARVLDGYGDLVADANTWGDGLFVAFDDVSAAARCALDIQGVIEDVRARTAELPVPLKMRISLHVGPVLMRYDPVRKRPTAYGRELTRAARIEPRTPAGEVYASGAFAALLCLDPDAGVIPEYVGRITTEKDFETIAMFVLKRDHTAR